MPTSNVIILTLDDDHDEGFQLVCSALIETTGLLAAPLSLFSGQLSRLLARAEARVPSSCAQVASYSGKPACWLPLGR